VKRIVLALGLLGAVQPALAVKPDVNLSGTFAASLSWYESHTNALDTTDVDLENNGSNFRIGAAAEEAGIRAFMVYERGAENEQLGIEEVREFYAGLDGRLGTLWAGRKATEYRVSGERLDPFYNTSAASLDGQFASEGASFGLSSLTTGYTANTVAYRTPQWGGFSGSVGAYIDDDNNNTTTGDEADFALGLAYANAELWGLEAGVQFLDLNGNVVQQTPVPPAQSTAVRAHASLGQERWSVGLSYERIDVEFEEDPRQHAFASATYQASETLRIAAAAGLVTDTRAPGATDEGAGGTIGLFWNLTRNLEAYTALRYVTLDNFAEEDNATLAGGMKFAFDVDL
jgi:predicted porin